MCPCLTKDEERLKIRVQEPDFKPAKAESLLSVSLQNVLLSFSHGSTVLGIPYIIRWKLQNGKEKEQIVPIIASHCPFCGKVMLEKEVVEDPGTPESETPGLQDSKTPKKTARKSRSGSARSSSSSS